MKKTTQRQLLFYLLYKEFKKHADKTQVPFIPLWKFMGDHHIDELKEWTFMSYEVSTTMSKLKADNPGIFEEKDWQNKNGSVSIAYRISPKITKQMLKSQDLIQFYARIQKK
jgi:hypothetical protein